MLYGEEGTSCRNSDCTGYYKYEPVENCSCHINPPCSNCVDNETACSICGMSWDCWEYGDE